MYGTLIDLENAIDLEGLEEQVNQTENLQLKVLMAIAGRLHNISVSLERLGFNGAAGKGDDDRGALERPIFRPRLSP